MGYRVINGQMYPMNEFLHSSSSVQKSNKIESCFDKILDSKISCNSDFTISSHAVKRLQDRNIKLDKTDMDNINKGLNLAKEKGAKDSLILYKDLALIASVKNRTIITAMDKNKDSENVFTNIDSVVLL
ncbi:hypothetical protein CLHOM_05970 [Clostridium homopropionicum DSM 5847]|uniref:Flagellar operon protein n=1 Tax=Clostridium homopropionicum DSM 5847 TaxID=1121318 RepID=A0A0L6ZDF0_9CLOT|nr:TIGR02530 family flagellar biosynthesis protein [Clostridium homopropionicum]KOA21009.1 hypothetical protein CLHOM_05970 [Clostridium homopropionicum DSM 5847]SFF99586.1 flagellar operon protein [Clostridium homopropionicum]